MGIRYVQPVQERLTIKDFAAIDFETVNRRRSSICSVGVAIARNGKMVDKFHLSETACGYNRKTTTIRLRMQRLALG